MTVTAYQNRQVAVHMWPTSGACVKGRSAVAKGVCLALCEGVDGTDVADIFDVASYIDCDERDMLVR